MPRPRSPLLSSLSSILRPRTEYICSSCQHQRLRPLASATNTKPPSKQPKPKPKPESKDDFYALLLASPLTHPAASTRIPIPSKSAPPSTPDALSKATASSPSKFIYSSPLAGSLSSRALSDLSVDTRPSEPDNCCMSGCAHCVWDIYREELEVWAANRKRNLLSASKGDSPSTMSATPHIDDDGVLPSLGGNDEDELFGGLDVGMREFMRVEKMLRTKRRAVK